MLYCFGANGVKSMLTWLHYLNVCSNFSWPFLFKSSQFSQDKTASAIYLTILQGVIISGKNYTDSLSKSSWELPGQVNPPPLLKASMGEIYKEFLHNILQREMINELFFSGPLWIFVWEQRYYSSLIYIYVAQSSWQVTDASNGPLKALLDKGSDLNFMIRIPRYWNRLPIKKWTDYFINIYCITQYLEQSIVIWLCQGIICLGNIVLYRLYCFISLQTPMISLYQWKRKIKIKLQKIC